MKTSGIPFVILTKLLYDTICLFLADEVWYLLDNFKRVKKHKSIISDCNGTTAMDTTIESNSSFHVKFFGGFLLVLKKISFWEEDGALGNNFMKF